MATYGEISSAQQASQRLGAGGDGAGTYEQYLSAYNAGRRTGAGGDGFGTYGQWQSRAIWLSQAGDLLGLATLYMDFTQNAARLNGSASSAISLLTTTRASVAQMDSSSGFWGQFAANAPRWSDKGLLVEEQRVNSIRNNTMTGAVAGTPGTLPTNWGQIGGIPGGLTRTIVGTGNENGIDYIDIQYAGTPTGSFGVVDFDTPGAVASPGQDWAGSFFYKLAAGSMTNVISWQTNVQQLGGAGQTAINLATPTNVFQRGVANRNMPASTTAALLRFVFNTTIGQAIDFTVRIGWPQLEQGGFVTSPIKTSGAAATRAADTVVFATPATFVLSAPFSLFGEWTETAGPVSTARFALRARVDANNSNLLGLSAANKLQFQETVAGSIDLTLVSTGSVVAGTVYKIAAGVSLNDAAVVNSLEGNVQTDTVVGYPVGVVTSMGIGNSGVGANFLNGYVRRAAYWSSRLTNAQLQAIAA